MKKLFVLVLCSLLAAAAAAGCGKSGNSQMLKVGILQLVEHPALDASYKGFVEGLAEKGLADGKNIVIDYQNAQGEQVNCNTIATKFVNARYDLILAIATPAAQAAANLTKDIPVLVTAVTDPQAAGLVKDNAMPGTNVSGTSDLTPCAAQIDLIKKLVPAVKTIGLMYCSSEQNSVFQIALAKNQCKKLGINFIDATVSSLNEVQQVMQGLVGKVDAVYVPTDNMLASGMATVSKIAVDNKIPVVAGEDGMVKNGALATYGINYFELGKLTGEMGYEILKNGKKPAEMPVQYLQTFDFSFNEKTAQAIGIKKPADLK